MANLEKHSRGAVGGLCRHFERYRLPNGEYIKFNNGEINTKLTHLNYNLAPLRPQGQIEFINQRCGEVTCLKRDDVNVMITWIVTLPKGFPLDKSREFFERSYWFLCNRYFDGKEDNIISSYCHLDESQPHMHWAVVPIVRDKKSGREKVSAKELITKKDLKNFHKDLEKYLSEHFGFEVGILNGATKGGNLSIEELKRQSNIEELKRQESELRESIKNMQESMSVGSAENKESNDVHKTENLSSREIELKAEIERLENEEIPDNINLVDVRFWHKSKEINIHKAEHDLAIIQGRTPESFSAFSTRRRLEQAKKYEERKIPVVDKNVPLAPIVPVVITQPPVSAKLDRVRAIRELNAKMARAELKKLSQKIDFTKADYEDDIQFMDSENEKQLGE
jgi:hypothetical protein